MLFAENCCKEMIKKRKKLYLIYNWIFFIRELDKEKKIKLPEETDTKVSDYITTINQSLKQAELDELIVTMGDYDKYIKLLFRQDAKVRDFFSKAQESQLRSKFTKYFKSVINERSGGADREKQLSALVSLSDEGCDCCNFMCGDEKIQSLWSRYQSKDQESFRYVKIGKRIIGIADNNDRYAYDFGVFNQSTADTYKQLAKIEKDCMDEIQSSSLENPDWIEGFNNIVLKTIDSLKNIDSDFSNKFCNSFRGNYQAMPFG